MEGESISEVRLAIFRLDITTQMQRVSSILTERTSWGDGQQSSDVVVLETDISNSRTEIDSCVVNGAIVQWPTESNLNGCGGINR